MLQSTKDEELTAGQKKLPPALQKAIEKKDKKEEVEITERSGGPEGTSGGGMDALRAIKAKRQRLQGELEALNKDDPSYKEKKAAKQKEIEAQKEIMARKQREVFDSYDPNLDDLLDLYEGGFKDIDIRKGDLKLAKDKKQALKDKYNAIMANQTQGDEDSVADQIQKLDASIKKQEQELIDIMKKGKENQKNEAVDPERVQKLNQKIASMTTKIGELDKSKPENKTKEAILKSDIVTAKLRLQDLMQKGASDVKKAVNEASKAKQSYKSLKMSLKKEQEVSNKKKTLTDKPITKIEVNPKIEG
jgi:DNA repair exonuclease SbcCD ATPase subunit